MLLTNPYKPDARVRREAMGLVESGYQVTIICWDRAAEYPAYENDNGIELIRVHDVRSSYVVGWRQLFYLPRFWRKAAELAIKLDPDFIHCHDLDTLGAGWTIKRRTGCTLIYDSHEHYPAVMSLYLPRPLIWLLALWESWLQRKAEATITASSILRDEMITSGMAPVITLGNFPNLEAFTEVTVASIKSERLALGVPEDELLVAYIAGFTRDRVLLPFIEAAGLLPEVHFHIWGNGAQRDQVEEAVEKYDNVIHHGWLEHDRLPTVFRTVDIVYYGLRTDYPGAVYNAPNTLGQAMAAARPVIATDVGDLGRIVHETGCGLLLGDATPQSIAGAIEDLKDKNVRATLGERGYAAALTTYNERAIQKRLVNLYEKVTAGSNHLRLEEEP